MKRWHEMNAGELRECLDRRNAEALERWKSGGEFIDLELLLIARRALELAEAGR